MVYQCVNYASYKKSGTKILIGVKSYITPLLKQLYWLPISTYFRGLAKFEKFQGILRNMFFAA